MDNCTPDDRRRGDTPPARPLILIADDSRVVTELLRRILQQYGADVITASDGIAAEQAGLDHPIDLAILDQVMPGRIGAEILQGWRAAGMNAPVIMISAVEDRRTRAEALRLGVDQYLYKPISGAELIAEVQRLLEAPRTEASS